MRVGCWEPPSHPHMHQQAWRQCRGRSAFRREQVQPHQMRGYQKEGRGALLEELEVVGGWAISLTCGKNCTLDLKRKGG